MWCDLTRVSHRRPRHFRQNPHRFTSHKTMLYCPLLPPYHYSNMKNIPFPKPSPEVVNSAEYKALYQMCRRKLNKVYRTKSLYYKHLSRALKNPNFKYVTVKNNTPKLTAIARIVQCDAETFKEHIEYQFKPGMAWENHGTVWHIDHIIPLATATTLKDAHRLFHYRNLQPLFPEENSAKGSTLPDGTKPTCEKMLDFSAAFYRHQILAITPYLNDFP